MDLWSFALAGLGMAQIWLTGRKQRIGWLVGLATSCTWVVFALVSQQYGFIISSLFFGTLHIKNWIAWGKPNH
jgi:nicotinamide riboside transporter PnuC